MIETLQTDSAWAGRIVMFGADVAVKATVLCLMAIVCDRLVLRRWVLIRSALWNAGLVALLLLPCATAAFPRFRIPVLPPGQSQHPVARTEPLRQQPAGAEPGRSVTEALIDGTPEPYERAAVERQLAQAAALAEKVSATPAAPPSAGRPSHESVPEPAKDVAVVGTPASGTESGIEPRGEAVGATHTVMDRLRGHWNWQALVGLIYAAGILLLAVRLACSLIAVGILRRSGTPVTDVEWLGDLACWRNRLGIRRPVSLVRTARVGVPTVIGWMRATILLPLSLAGPIPRASREAILIHELAHVRRGDYLWQIVLRIVQIAYWPHPLIWVAGRLAAIVREQACDALCVHSLSGAESYGSVLIDVAAGLVRRGPRPGWVGAPMARSTRLARRLRQLDTGIGLARCLTGRSPRIVLTFMAVGAMGIIAPVELVHRTAVAQQPPPSQEASVTSQPAVSNPTSSPSTPAETNAVTASSAWLPGRVLDFHVVDGRTESPLADVDIHVSIDRQRSEGKSDAQGRYRITLPDKEPWEVIVNASRPQFISMGVYFRGFNKHFDVPDRYTLKMRPGTTIGGIVHDEAGRPIAGATVVIYLHGSEMEHICLSDHEEKTNSDGRWQCNEVPENIEGIGVGVRHPDYIGDRNAWVRPTPSLKQLRDGSYVMVMKKGLAITGTVLGKEGKPVKGAYVLLGRDAEVDELPQTRTDEQGRYRLGCSQPGETVLTVYAPGHAPEQKTLNVAPDLAPVEFRLGPPHTIRGRVVDASGTPIAGANVLPSQWHGLSFHEFKLKTDAEGRFRWDNAPSDAVGVSVNKVGYAFVRDIQFTPTDAEQVVRLIRTPIVRGTVVDAQTGDPITGFTVLQGKGNPVDPINWDHSMQKVFGNGRYSVNYTDVASHYQVRIEADGYEPAVSRVFEPDKAEQVCDFKLSKTSGATGTVRLPDGSPLSGATVLALPPKTTLFVRNGKPLTGRIRRTQTDRDGRFTLYPQEPRFGLVVIHERGYAEVPAGQIAASRAITVQPWGRVEGTLRIAGKPGAREPLELQPDVQLYQRDLQVSHTLEATTDASGTFVFERVPPGKVKIRRDIQHSPTTLSSAYDTHAEVQPGEMIRVAIGSTDSRPTCRTVVGRIVPPPGSTQTINWRGDQFACVTGDALGLPPADRISAVDALRVAARRRSSTTRVAVPFQVNFRVGPDGSFRLDDLLPGSYRLDVRLHKPNPIGLAERDQIGEVKHQFTVPEPTLADGNKPVDLGNLEFSFRKELKVGDEAPLFDIELTKDATSDTDRRLRLADYVGRTGSGKFVLLTIWSGGFGDWMKAEWEYYKVVLDAYRKDDRLVMIFVSVDRYDTQLEAILGKDDPRFIQSVLSFMGDKMLRDYGIMELPFLHPKIFLIGPDGTILAKDLRGSGVRGAPGGKNVVAFAPAPSIKAALASALGPPGAKAAASAPTSTPAAATSPTGKTRSLLTVNRQTRSPLAGVQLTIVGGEPGSAITNDGGRSVIRIGPEGAAFLFVTAEKPGFVPLMVKWSNGKTFDNDSQEFALAMEPATTIGGVVRDQAGKSIKDAGVELNLRRPDPEAGPNTQIKIWDRLVRTDPEGRWQFDLAPARLDDLSIRVRHPGYETIELTAQSASSVEALRRKTQATVLKAKGTGIAILGSVLDRQDRPIPGASVSVRSPGKDTSLLEAVSGGKKGETTRTDPDGRFCLYQAKIEGAFLLAQATGYAPDLQRVKATPEGPRVDFRLGPGHTIRGRVVNAKNEPLAEVGVLSGRWRGIDETLAHLRTDRDGRFVWDSAPPDEMEFTFITGDYPVLSTPLSPSKTEHVITLYRSPHISGSVVDADTGRPVEKFKLLPHGDQPMDMLWNMGKSVRTAPGHYDIRCENATALEHFKFRIEAEGYGTFFSRQFGNQDEEVIYDVKLKKVAWLTGTVRSPQGRPLADALVLADGSSDLIRIENRKLSDFPSSNLTTTRTGPDGRFSVPQSPKPGGLLVLHERGWARVPMKQAPPCDVVIQPWGRLEGSVRIGTRPGAFLNVQLIVRADGTSELPAVQHECTATSDAGGQFVMERVFPSNGRIGYTPKTGEPDAILSHAVPVAIAAGQTAHVTIGGTGRPITGRIALPSGTRAEGDLVWNSEFNRITSVQPKPPMPDDIRQAPWKTRRQWWQTWSKTREGKAWQMAFRRLAVHVQPDGAFRAEDVSAGEYELHVQVMRKTKPAQSILGNKLDGEPVGSVRRSFTVPEMPGGRNDTPLDLGTLTLQPPKRLRPGDPAPSFEVETHDGKRLKLSDFRGKHVLVIFSLAPRVTESPILNSIAGTCSRDGRLVMLSVDLMPTMLGTLADPGFLQWADPGDTIVPWMIQEPAKTAPSSWHYAYADMEIAPTLLEDYGLSPDFMSLRESTVFLIGPEGKIVAANLMIGEALSAVTDALGGAQDKE